ncbi:RNA polymerase sigma factor SigM [Micromonospora rifamycinica]|uniref:RNA polymerase sigma factor SigM n=1 Tax=Micromonospora rifamycinica TaxID=291594 RepID=UPI003F540252
MVGPGGHPTDPAAGGSASVVLPHTDTADLDLLRAHVAGDRDAFTELFHRHRDRLWAVALRTVGDREEAADALQDALLSAHRAAARFRGDSAVTTWLHRIVVNACLDRIRRRQAHPTLPLPDGNHTDGSGRVVGVEPAAPATDHDTALVVRQALAGLPVEQRAALILVDVQGYPVAEVARILGVAEGTVKSRCARGRARLAGVLGHLRTGDDTPTSRSAGTGPAGAGGGSDGSSRTGQDVSDVTPGNRQPAHGVRPGSGQTRRGAIQEET